MKKICIQCGKEFNGYNTSQLCSDDCRKEKRRQYSQRPEVKERQRQYSQRYNQRPEVKERKRQYEKQHIYVCLAGKTTKVYTDGVTEELKPLIPKLKEKVLNDCIKNPRKYLSKTEPPKKRLIHKE